MEPLKTMSPHVVTSVIIPAINESKRIARAIESAWQAGADEVVVADGGSSDSTCDIADQLGCQVVKSNPGRGLQQNAGVQASTGDLLVFLHADNRLARECLVQAEKELIRSPLCYGGFRQKIEADGRRFRWLESGNAFRLKRIGLVYGDQSLFVGRDLLQQVGGFPTEPLMEDVILSQRLAKARGVRRLLPGPVHVEARRWQAHGVLRQTLRNWWLLTQFFLGVPPQTLARQYRRHDQSAKGE